MAVGGAGVLVGRWVFVGRGVLVGRAVGRAVLVGRVVGRKVAVDVDVDGALVEVRAAPPVAVAGGLTGRSVEAALDSVVVASTRLAAAGSST